MAVSPKQSTCLRCPVTLFWRGSSNHEDPSGSAWPAHRHRFSIDNQPRLNAVTRQMLSKLGGLWDVLERDPTCRCVILTGAGQRTFTVGTDISDDLSAGPEVARG
jgi:hypothetical protein